MLVSSGSKDLFSRDIEPLNPCDLTIFVLVNALPVCGAVMGVVGGRFGSDDELSSDPKDTTIPLSGTEAVDFDFRSGCFRTVILVPVSVQVVVPAHALAQLRVLVLL